MTTAAANRITTTQLLVPMALMAFVMTLLFAFQLTQVLRERDNLVAISANLDTPIENAQKLNSQFGGLVLGTQKLASEGNKSAILLTDQLKKIGIIQEPKAQVPGMGGGMAPVPAASTPSQPGPVKP